jgi:hypothetical protein
MVLTVEHPRLAMIEGNAGGLSGGGRALEDREEAVSE